MRGVGICALIASVGLCSAQHPTPASLVVLARQAVIDEVGGKAPPHGLPKDPPKPVFVTIERNGKVLGCRGSLTAHLGSLQEEVIAAARSAAAHDPRYRSLTPRDLDGFLVTVTVVDREEPIDTVSDLRPEDGLILRSGARTGIVLPWEGKDPLVRLRWAYTKASVPFGSSARLARLIAERTRG